MSLRLSSGIKAKKASWKIIKCRDCLENWRFLGNGCEVALLKEEVVSGVGDSSLSGRQYCGRGHFATRKGCTLDNQTVTSSRSLPDIQLRVLFDDHPKAEETAGSFFTSFYYKY